MKKEKIWDESPKTGFRLSTNSLIKLKEAIMELPNNIKRLSVQSSLDLFQPSFEEITTNIENWRESTILLIDIVMTLPEGNEIDEFSISPYYGDPNRDHYLRFSRKKSRKFARDMSSGKYGSLD